MSYYVYYLIILHLCVSMHAYTSRPLGVFQLGHGKGIRLTSKTSEIMAEIKGENVNENIIERNESNVEFHSDKPNMLKGSDIKVQVSQEETQVEGWKDHARSTMESKQQDSKEAINNSETNIVTEDVVVMDYAQPHRKPPIHNLTP
uniref:uncharacterized protein LOC122600346 n=1 Tax=Erigeron canadensis TaxID=72917 RepID=UPI001CB99479|nr:uncharacterized protein LOC122600346 [Erigeron canadensis]